MLGTYNGPSGSSPKLPTPCCDLPLAVIAVADAPIQVRRCSSCTVELAPSERFCSRYVAAGTDPLEQPTASFQAPTPRSASRSRVAGEHVAPGQLVVERFRIVTALGRVGMGEVFRADDLSFGQSVALKFLAERRAVMHLPAAIFGSTFHRADGKC